jgi:hypothetical protein
VVGAGGGAIAGALLFLVAHRGIFDDGYITLSYAKTLAFHGSWGVTEFRTANTATSPLKPAAHNRKTPRSSCSVTRSPCYAARRSRVWLSLLVEVCLWCRVPCQSGSGDHDRVDACIRRRYDQLRVQSRRSRSRSDRLACAERRVVSRQRTPALRACCQRVPFTCPRASAGRSGSRCRVEIATLWVRVCPIAACVVDIGHLRHMVGAGGRYRGGSGFGSDPAEGGAIPAWDA